MPEPCVTCSCLIWFNILCVCMGGGVLKMWLNGQRWWMPVKDTLQVGFSYRASWQRAEESLGQIKSYTARAGCLYSNEAWRWEIGSGLSIPTTWPLNTDKHDAEPSSAPCCLWFFCFCWSSNSFQVFALNLFMYFLFTRPSPVFILASLFTPHLSHFHLFSIYRLTLGNSVFFSLQPRIVNIEALDWWQFLMGTLRLYYPPVCTVVVSIGTFWTCLKERRKRKGFSVGLRCLFICFVCSFLNSVWNVSYFALISLTCLKVLVDLLLTRYLYHSLLEGRIGSTEVSICSVGAGLKRIEVKNILRKITWIIKIMKTCLN